MALGLARAGHRVAIVDKNADALAECVAQAPAADGQTLAGVVDLADRDACNRVIENVHTRWDHIDVVVNNAAVTPGAVRRGFCNKPTIKAWDIPTGTWELAFHVNVTVPFLLMREIVPG